MSLLLPEARLGLMRHIGALRDDAGRPRLEVLGIDHLAVIHVWEYPLARGRPRAEKVYTVELSGHKAEQAAEMLDQMAIYATSGRVGCRRAILGPAGRPGIDVVSGEAAVDVMFWKHPDDGAASFVIHRSTLSPQHASQFAKMLLLASGRALLIKDSPMPNRLPGLPVGR